MAYSEGQVCSVNPGMGQPFASAGATIEGGARDNPSVQNGLPVTGGRNRRDYRGLSGTTLAQFGDAVILTPEEIAAANAEAQQGIEFVKKNALWFLIGGLLLYKFLFRKED